MEDEYLTKQILTYMGNKRKFLNKIDEIITLIKNETGEKNINIAEGFSGSGIVSRLFKNRVMSDNDSGQELKSLYVNDMAGYSKTLNECYLTSTKDLTTNDYEILILHKKKLRSILSKSKIPKKFISKYWSPNNDNNIKEGERAYFTHKNACNIDKMMYYIKNKIEKKYQCFFLAPLLVNCSIHNNTNGQFSAYYKNEEKTKGMYGGKNKVDLNRITGEILPELPILTEHKADVKISQMDTNEWVKTLPMVDLMYYDPPYNKHPYNIYYFLIDIINNWDTSIEIPETYRGQPKNWVKSPYCSFVKAKESFEDLIKNTKAKYILISYNNKGIIPLKELDEILEKYGELRKIPVEHSVYNKLIGIAAKKRQKKNTKVEEFLWLLKKGT
jgi:adenine-specific DNA-methyltransferase